MIVDYADAEDSFCKVPVVMRIEFHVDLERCNSKRVDPSHTKQCKSVWVRL